MEMVSVTFTEDCVVDDQHKGTAREISFKEGEVVELPLSSAEHWINRGRAVPGDLKKLEAAKKREAKAAAKNAEAAAAKAEQEAKDKAEQEAKDKAAGGNGSGAGGGAEG
ncbi:MAG: hypothetical protein ACTSWM_10055 [Alphaproteobacteria bacterium]